MRPSFSDLTADQQAHFGNGLGPFWLPDPVRKFITETASWFFKSASWRHHDFGYSLGYTEAHRRLYDWKFFKAMLNDALRQPWHIWLIASPLAVFLAVAFFLSVFLFGWISSFHYGGRYRSIDEILADYEELAELKPS